MSKRWTKWMPAAVVPLVIAGLAIVAPMTASAGVALPSKTPQQVLELVATSTVHAFSGEVTQTSDLGLPDLSSALQTAPTTSAGSSSSTANITTLLGMLTGTHSLRIYVDGAKDARVQLMASLAEQDLVKHGKDVWAWDSKTRTATHLSLPASRLGPKALEPSTLPTPSALATTLLGSIDKTTSVTVGTNQRVAGQPAYTLILTPKGSSTLIESVSIAVDAANGMPLSLEIRAHGQAAPAFRIAFTSVSFSAPATSLFSFTPPAGAIVKQVALPSKLGRSATEPTSPKAPNVSKIKPTVIGTGWQTIVELPAGALPASITNSPLLGQLAQRVTGGTLLSTSLVNVLLTTDGRVFAGSVPVAALEAAAAK